MDPARSRAGAHHAAPAARRRPGHGPRGRDLRGWAFLALFGLCGGCGREAPGKADSAGHASTPVRVFASASLGPVFDALEEEFESTHPEWNLEVHVAGTPTLVLQLESGAPAAVFASASEAHMERVRERGLLGGEPIPFATNRMAIAVAEGNPEGIRGLEDLARRDLIVALCAPAVPSGRYARLVLERAGVTVRSVSDESSVTALLAKVRLGEIDAGIVYATDAGTEGVECVSIEPHRNLTSPCSIAELVCDRSCEGGAEFIAFLLSAPGVAILSEFGFGPIPAR